MQPPVEAAHPQSSIGFLRDRARRSTEEVVAFIDAHRTRESGGLRWGVEPICHALEIAPTTYWSAKTRTPCARATRDAELGPTLEALWVKNYSVYGRRKLTRAARKTGIDIGRDQVARLMRANGLRGWRAFAQGLGQSSDGLHLRLFRRGLRSPSA